MKEQQLTTPIGEALFSHVKSTEIISGKDTGKYTVMLKLKSADAADLKEKIVACWERFKESDECKGKKFGKADPSLGTKEYKDEEYFKFSANKDIKCRNGETFENRVALFDAMGKIVGDKIKEIGNGSKIRVAFDPIPFYMTKDTHGVSLRLKAIQILDLKEYGDAQSFGFEADETGWTSDEEASVPSDDVPFLTDEDSDF